MQLRVGSLWDEFKAFAFKGNMIDLAVAVVIGAAFGKIIDSLVKNIIMPAVSVLLPTDQSYLAWKLTINGQDIPYGLFLGELLNFFIVAIAVWIFIVKFLGLLRRAKKEEEAAPAPAPEPALSKEAELLVEIRDLLKQRSDR